MKQLSAQELHNWLQQNNDGALANKPTLIDVRAGWEYQQDHIESAIHFELRRLMDNELPPNLEMSSPIVCICHHGMRSKQAAMLLETAGFTNVYNLVGGIDAWSIDVDPNIDRY